MTFLLKNQSNQWATYNPLAPAVQQEFKQFDTIELAADYLENKFKVHDKEIDAAIAYMAALNKHIAMFDAMGLFVGVK